MGPAGGWLKVAFDLGDDVAAFGRHCANSGGRRGRPLWQTGKRRPEIQNSRRPVRKRRELWERWWEAGNRRVSLQGPMLKLPRHWEISSDHNAAGEALCSLFREPIGGRSRPDTMHEVQGQLPRPGPPYPERLFAAMSESRSRHLFRSRRGRSQRPARASGCRTAAPALREEEEIKPVALREYVQMAKASVRVQERSWCGSSLSFAFSLGTILAALPD
jgi:hypothetical protein